VKGGGSSSTAISFLERLSDSAGTTGVVSVICNIIDRRQRRYRWAKINAIIEATWHDNFVADTDIAPEVNDQGEVVYDRLEGVAAERWAP
jgi:hypothetical protein